MLPKGQESTTDSIGFLVNEEPVAVYGDRLKHSTDNYVRGFDATYWEYQEKLVLAVPKGSEDHTHLAFTRLTLSHTLEHLFGLICAFLQAPYCPDLWLYRYKPSDLPVMVGKLSRGEAILTAFKRNPASWSEVVATVWPYLDERRAELTARILERLATELCSEQSRDEYNGIKHGLRLSMGGTAISFAPGGSPDEVPPREKFISLGDSQFGSRAWSFKRIGSSKRHLHATLNFANWDYAELATLLRHAVLLIGNMGPAMRRFLEIEGEEFFRYFSKDDAYTQDSRTLSGLTTGKWVTEIEIPDDELMDLEAVKMRYLNDAR